MNTNGILHEGPGLNGKPAGLILTGTDAASENDKTGAMQQITALVTGISAGLALRTGADEAVCGTCTLRGGRALFGKGWTRTLRLALRGAPVLETGWLLFAYLLVSIPRVCYVNIRSPETMSKKYRGIPVRTGTTARPYQAGAIRPGLPLRFGSYGEVAGLVPLRKALGWARTAGRWTGYTELWTEGALWRWRRLLMASCQSLAEAADAVRRGWRPFLVLEEGEPAPQEIEGLRMVQCPADPTLPKREKPVTCAACGICDGTEKGRKVGVWIRSHGTAGPLLAKVKAILALLFTDTPETLEV